MSDDNFINQLTLNCLINKHQLSKLYKKMKEETDESRNKEIKTWQPRIVNLFNVLLENNEPNDLMLDVKQSFDAFVDKSIYYLKNHDRTIELEKERLKKPDIQDDIDFEQEEKSIERGNYVEESQNEPDEEFVDEESPDEEVPDQDEEEIYDFQEEEKTLPLNWFERVQQNYQKNKIMPRKR
jgi:hypothetical protein